MKFLINVFVDPLPSALEAFVNVNSVSVLATASRGLMEGNAQLGHIHRARDGRCAHRLFAPPTRRLYGSG